MPTAAPWADVACRASPDGRPHRPQSKPGHRSRRSGKPPGSVCRSSPLPSCVLQLAPLSPAQAATTTRGRPQLRPQDWIRSQTPGSPPVRRSQTSAAAALHPVGQCRSSMVSSPGHQLADPDHQQWPPHNAQTCAAGAERGIDAATAPNRRVRARLLVPHASYATQPYELRPVDQAVYLCNALHVEGRPPPTERGRHRGRPPAGAAEGGCSRWSTSTPPGLEPLHCPCGWS